MVQAYQFAIINYEFPITISELLITMLLFLYTCGPFSLPLFSKTETVTLDLNPNRALL